MPTNKGLPTTFQSINQLYTQQLNLTDTMSRADFNALCGTIAASLAVPEGSPVPPELDPLTFKWGRVDCATAPAALDEQALDFPAPGWEYNSVVAYFARRWVPYRCCVAL